MSSDETEEPRAGYGQPEPPAPAVPEACVVCGSGDLMEFQCKVICRNCGTILMSCEDL